LPDASVLGSSRLGSSRLGSSRLGSSHFLSVPRPLASPPRSLSLPRLSLSFTARSSMEDSIPSIPDPVPGMKAAWTNAEDMILVQALVRGAERCAEDPFDFKQAVQDLKSHTTNGAVKTVSSCRSRWHRVSIHLVSNPLS
jgi:hypothetical protein